MLNSRRNFLLRLMLLAVLCGSAQIAVAESGSGSSGSSNSSSDDSSDSDSSGSGSSGDDDSSGSDDDDSENSGSGNDDRDDVENNGNEIDQDDAREAVRTGSAMALRKAMKRAKDQTEGRIIDVKLERKSGKFIYVFTVVEPSGRIKRLKMDAVSGKFAGALGF